MHVRFPLFGMIMLIWLTFINADKCTQAQEALDTTNSTLTEDIECTFESGPALYCGWKQQNWESAQMLNKSNLILYSSNGSAEKYVDVLQPTSPSSLTSPVTRATGEITDCLEFYFFITGVNATLMVSIGRKDCTTILWRYTSNNYNITPEWSLAYLPVKSPQDFRVIIESLPTIDARSVIAVDEIRRSRNLSCTLKPAEAEVDQTTSSPTSTSRPDIVSSSFRPSSSITHSGTVTLPDVPSDKSVYSSTTYTTYLNAGPTEEDIEKKSDSTDNTAVLAGAVTAGVVLLVIILFVIAGVVIWKRRSTENKKTQDCEITNDQGNDSTVADSSSDLNTGTDRPPLSSSNHTFDSGYSDVTPVGFEPNYSGNPYTLADDESVGNTHFKITPLVDRNQDEYNVLSIHGNKVPQTHVTEIDNYSHINNIQPTVPDISALYSQVNKKGKSVAEHRLDPDESPLYAEVKKNGKPAASSGNRLRTGSATSELNIQQTGGLNGFRSADCSVRLSDDAIPFHPAAEPDEKALYAQVQKKGRGVSSKAKTSDKDIIAFCSQEMNSKLKPAIAKKPTISNTPTTADN